MSAHKPGFTLIELLVVISIIAILIVVVFVSLDPLKQFREARNARRWSQVGSLSTAIFRFMIENDRYPTGLDSDLRQLGTAISGCEANCPGATAKCLDIQSEISDYMPILPTDLNGGSPDKTGFAIRKNPQNNVITVSACLAENNAQIFVMR